MLKAYRYRIYPNELQKAHFSQAMGCVRYVYNKALETRKSHYKTTGKSLNAIDMCSPGGLLPQEKQEHDWLKLPHSQSLQMSIRNLDTAYKNFFEGNADFPVFKKRRNGGSLQYPQKVYVDFKRSKVKIPKAGEILCVFDRKFDGKIKTCTVSKTATNKYFISILVDNDLPLPIKFPIKEATTIGIDLGLTHFAILSDGTKIENPRFAKKQTKRLACLQRRASRKVKGSNNQRKVYLKVARLYETIANQRTNFLQQLSTKIVRENQTIILEDLNVAGMLRNHCLAFGIADVAWSAFNRMIHYKTEWYGNNLIKIGRFEPSSKNCHCCGEKNTELTLKDREWTCSHCGAYHDRDVNAAINIKNVGLLKALAGSERPEELAEMPTSAKTAKGLGKLDRRSKKSKTVSTV